MDDGRATVLGLDDVGGGRLRFETGGLTDCSLSSMTGERPGAVEEVVGKLMCDLSGVSGSSLGASFTSGIPGSLERREGVDSPIEVKCSSSLRKCGDLDPGEPLPRLDIVLCRD